MLRHLSVNIYAMQTPESKIKSTSTKKLNSRTLGLYGEAEGRRLRKANIINMQGSL